jgi:hypothetical protein
MAKKLFYVPNFVMKEPTQGEAEEVVATAAPVSAPAEVPVSPHVSAVAEETQNAVSETLGRQVSPELPMSRARLSKFINAEMSKQQVRKFRQIMKAKKNFFPQFIADDGSVWTIRQMKGSNGHEVLTVGKQRSKKTTEVDIDTFVTNANASIKKWKDIAERLAIDAADGAKA